MNLLPVILSGGSGTRPWLLSREQTPKLPLEIIEVQSGTWPGEDDIVRFDDHYGRN